MNLELRDFKYPEEFDSYLKLFNDAFPEVGGGSKKRFDWLLHEFPYKVEGKPSFEYGAYLDNEMVGFYAAVPFRYKIGAEETPVGMTCGVMTSSAHRGKGIFTKLGRFATESMSQYVPFLTGYPIRSAVLPGHLKVGWKVAFELPLHIRPVKTNSFLQTKRLGWLSPIANIGANCWNLCFNKKTKDKNINICIDSNIPEGDSWKFLLAKWENSIANKLQKTPEFMNWRFSRPGYEYKFVKLSRHGNLLGYAALRAVEKLGVPTLCIMDFISINDEISDLLHKSILQHAKSINAEVILTMMSRHSAKTYRLYKNGYLVTKNIFRFIIKNLTDKFTDSQLTEEKNWHLMWIDSDDL